MNSMHRGRWQHSAISTGIVIALIFSVFGLTMARPQNVVAATTNIAIVSGAGTPIVGVYNKAGHVNNYVDLSSSPLAAVQAAEPAPYPDVYTVGAINSTWDEGVGLWFQNSSANPQWIWETAYANGPASYDPSSELYDADASISGRVVSFAKTFPIPADGVPGDAVLHIAADNGWEAWVNNGTHYYSGTVLGAGWAASNLHEASLNTSGWQNYGTITIAAAEFIAGANVLHVLAGNEYFAADDGNDPTPASRYNPGAAIFELDVTYVTPDMGTLTIVKNTTGGDGTFGYTVSAGPSTVADQELTTVGGTKSVLIDVIAGTYHVAEKALPAGWLASGDMAMDVVVPPNETGTATFNNTLVHPGTQVTISPGVSETLLGGNVNLTITETNTGDWDLENISVTLDPVSIILTNASPSFVGGDTGTIGILSPGEVWTWQYPATISVDTTFTVTGSGKVVGLPDIVTYPQYPNEQASAAVRVMGGATRTQGFWSTHLDFTTYIFNTYLPSGINLGYKNVTNIADLMGIFWANNAKTSTGTKRSALSQAREIAANQALAAILNSAMPGGTPLPAEYSLTQIAAILGETDINAIKALNSTLDMFNNSGDNVALNPTLLLTGKANPQGAKAIANTSFAD